MPLLMRAYLINALKVVLKIQQIRQQRGLSVREVSYLSGISKSQISRIERGETEPTITTLISIADALGVELMDTMKIVRRNDENDE